MEIISSIQSVHSNILALKSDGRKIGFVPTMGALHEGHLSLIRRSKIENDITVCSVFVNPIQFNNAEDYAKYPIQQEKDIEMLGSAGCDIVFMPSKSEMYPADEVLPTYHFGMLEQVMEGAFRPGHFNGVAVVVKKLLDITFPDKAYFGEKDFQQLQIIKSLVKQEKLAVTIVPCPIVRENDGLAMSSRNQRLTADERAVAPEIYQHMKESVALAPAKSVDEIKDFFLSAMKKRGLFEVEYIEISDESTLQPITFWDQASSPRVFVAVFLGKIRLIDNMKIIL
jgi:pantoate--beta-alanine ligase